MGVEDVLQFFFLAVAVHAHACAACRRPCGLCVCGVFIIVASCTSRAIQKFV